MKEKSKSVLEKYEFFKSRLQSHSGRQRRTTFTFLHIKITFLHI